MFSSENHEWFSSISIKPNGMFNEKEDNIMPANVLAHWDVTINNIPLEYKKTYRAHHCFMT